MSLWKNEIDNDELFDAFADRQSSHPKSSLKIICIIRLNEHALAASAVVKATHMCVSAKVAAN
jgi:hypothetical protein